MGQVKKVVLAYSGGVDTSVCIPYLKKEYGIEEVIAFAADLGQGDELEPIRNKALSAGASVLALRSIAILFGQYSRLLGLLSVGVRPRAWGMAICIMGTWTLVSIIVGPLTSVI